MFFSAKAISEFFQLFFLNFNLVQYVRKKLHINANNLVRFFKNLALNWVQENKKMLINSKVIQNLRMHWNLDYFCNNFFKIQQNEFMLGSFYNTFW